MMGLDPTIIAKSQIFQLIFRFTALNIKYEKIFLGLYTKNRFVMKVGKDLRNVP